MPHSESHRGRRKGDNRRGGKYLLHSVKLAVGIKVMVAETDLDITNGKIMGIVLHPEHKEKSSHSEASVPAELDPCQPLKRAT
jgi:hypothetical protein